MEKPVKRVENRAVSRVKGIFQRIIRFFVESRNELRKVQWPNRKETTTYTTIVVVVSLGVSFFIWVVDQGLALVLRWLVS
jgi:preprotein translocase subunit SecE